MGMSVCKKQLIVNGWHKRMRWVLLIGLSLLTLAGIAKFYHYNYVANTLGQARLLKLTGLREFVCRGESYKSTAVDQCGDRSIWGDADWGVTGYLTIYGVQSEREARAIADFMADARRNDQQTNIPMDLEVFKLPRSRANSYKNIKIFHKHFDVED